MIWWDLTYTEDDDHHVQGLGSAIFNVTSEVPPTKFELSWNAGGVLSDYSGDDDYRWCYRYTLVFWNSSEFDAVSHNTYFDQHAGKDLNITLGEYLHEAGGTALLDIPGEFTVLHEKSEPRAVLPQGFGLAWKGEGNDHHVLQASFDLGTPPVGGPPVPPFTGGNTITWTSQTILKANEKAFDYMGSEVVNILSGQSVHMWQPRSVLHLIGANMVEEPTHLVLKPAEPSNGCIFDGSEEFEEFYVVEELPLDYAIPVLTGWDLQYACTNLEPARRGLGAPRYYER